MIIFDIDGVLADNSHRLHYALVDKNYDKYYSEEEVLKDEPIHQGLMLLHDLQKIGVEIHFVTGRNECCEKATASWLYRHGLNIKKGMKLCCRDEKDYRPSPIVKVELIKGLFEALDKERAGTFSTMEPYSGLFIDDDPENVIAVEKAFPNLKGIVFGIERLKDYEVRRQQ